MAVVEEAQPVEAEPMDGAEDEDRQNVSPGADTEVGIYPPKVTSVLKRALSCLSQPPPLQLDVYKSPSYQSHTNILSRSIEMESFAAKNRNP